MVPLSNYSFRFPVIAKIAFVIEYLLIKRKKVSMCFSFPRSNLLILFSTNKISKFCNS